MPRFVPVVCGLVLIAVSALTLDINVRDFCDKSGVYLGRGTKIVSLQPGQTIYAGTVGHPEKLAAFGLGRTDKGDQVVVTYIGGKQLRLQHTRSKREVTITASWLR